MSVDTLLWIIAFVLFIIAAYGVYAGRTVLVALGWIGFAAAALTFIV